MENLGLGFFLMVVGMVTVFSILLIVIYGSRGLINLVNKIAPEEQRPAKKQDGAANAPDALTVRVLEAAVSELTGGKGHIVNIKSLS